MQAMFSIKDNSISNDCWFAFICDIYWDLLDYSICINYSVFSGCREIIERECPDMMFIPSIPVLFGDIYFAYKKNHS
ncbi:unnamed protein product [Rotaria sordida]|uniref:Uncharacterized protein n=1 Tax=Rotaria sordida TaxID=392033 RepID=A0A815M345_9BILA|nr:unnamed protein product [Rotaria sordida]